MVLVDTAVIIDFLNQNSHKEAILQLLARGRFCTTEIIIMEVLQGIRSDEQYQKIKKFLESLPLIHLKYDDYLKAADIYRDCRKQGITIRKSIDCIIAALVINHNLKLFSVDRDFKHIREHFSLILFDAEKLKIEQATPIKKVAKR